MAAVEGLEKVVAALKARAAKSIKDDNVSVVVGTSVAYAIFVHEDLEAHHPVGQAKFLEQPARELQPTLAMIVRQALQKGQTLAQALLLAGLRLQREAQLLTPVKTGNLKASFFTRLDRGA